MTDTDAALEMLGKYSKWQMKNYLAFVIGYCTPYAWMLMTIVFIGDTPGHHCAVPANSTKNASLPLVCDGDECSYSQCTMYGDGNATVPCQNGWWYDPADGYTETIVTEWDLVCGYNWLVELSMALTNVGSWIAVLVFPWLSDKYGRKTLMCVCLWSNIVVATAQALAPNYYVYMALAVIDGMQQSGGMAIGCVLMVEMFPTSQRNFPMNCMEFFCPFGYISLSLIAYYIRHWRYLQLAVTLPLVLTLSYYWLLDESILWLVAQGRYDDANKTMKRAGKMNNVHIPDNLFTPDTQNVTKEDLIKDAEAPQKAELGITDIFRNWAMFIISIKLFFIWFTNNLTYYALTLNVTFLPGNRYVTNALYGLMEIPSYAITWILLEKVGRIKPMSAFMFLAGVALLGSCVQSTEWGEQNAWLTILLSNVGKFCVTCSYSAIVVATPEFFPTNIRSTGMGLCMSMSNIASIVGPYSRILSRLAPWIPPLISGIICLIAGVLVLTLPETRWRALPQSIEEVVTWSSESKTSGPEYELAQQHDDKAARI